MEVVNMKQQERLRRLTQQLKKTDAYIKKNKKFGCKKIQRYRFNLQTRIIQQTIKAQEERRKQR